MKACLLFLSVLFVLALSYSPRWIAFLLLLLPFAFYELQRFGQARLRSSLAFFWLVILAELLPLILCKPILFLQRGFVLPIGLSFLVFQALAFTVDWRRAKIPVFPGRMDFALYLLFFPKFLCGPLERFGHFQGELARARWFPREKLPESARLLLTGLAKKFLIANYLHPLTVAFFDQPGPPASLFTAAAATAVFALEFYCDFSAYTNLAEGTALLFGIELVPNFRQPYLARNPQDFWQRWHMSLSVWFRDYVHYPLFFLTKNISLAIFATFFLMGLWHGFGRNFLLLGAYWGMVMAFYAAIQPFRVRLTERWGESKAWKAGSIVLTLQIVLVSFFLLRADQAHAWSKLSWAEPWHWSSLAEQSVLRLLFCAPLIVALERWSLKPLRTIAAKAGMILLLAYYAFLLFFFTQEKGLTDVRFLYFQF